MKNFALVGVAGFVAPRHLQAIHNTGNRVIAAVDPHDAVGVLDRYFPETNFFTEFERFDRHVEKLRRGPHDGRVHYVSICSPNYLHDAHVRFALRVDADVICEKPLVIKPWNLDALLDLERETGRRVYSVLQLRLHPAIIALRERFAKDTSTKKKNIVLSYITPRGIWYLRSWKGSMERSGGLLTNIGIHFFDLLQLLFGGFQSGHVHLSDPAHMSGFLELERANVSWYLSVDRNDVPSEEKTAFRSLVIDGEEFNLSEGFTDLHTEVYSQALSGQGVGIEECRPSIELIYNLNTRPIEPNKGEVHPFAQKHLSKG